jgi:hypothetical protein
VSLILVGFAVLRPAADVTGNAHLRNTILSEKVPVTGDDRRLQLLLVSLAALLDLLGRYRPLSAAIGQHPAGDMPNPRSPTASLAS